MSPTFAEYDASYLEPLVRLWRESFEFGVGITDPHPLSEQREAFQTEVLPHNRATLALLEKRLIGFIASSPESVAQLQVQVGLHREGIGSALLTLAKAESSGSLWLYPFARNARACRFYEKHGFVVLARGFEPHLQLEDVKCGWPRSIFGDT